MIDFGNAAPETADSGCIKNSTFASQSAGGAGYETVFPEWLIQPLWKHMPRDPSVSRVAGSATLETHACLPNVFMDYRF